MRLLADEPGAVRHHRPRLGRRRIRLAPCSVEGVLVTFLLVILLCSGAASRSPVFRPFVYIVRVYLVFLGNGVRPAAKLPRVAAAGLLSVLMPLPGPLRLRVEFSQSKPSSYVVNGRFECVQPMPIPGAGSVDAAGPYEPVLVRIRFRMQRPAVIVPSGPEARGAHLAETSSHCLSSSLLRPAAHADNCCVSAAAGTAASTEITNTIAST